MVIILQDRSSPVLSKSAGDVDYIIYHQKTTTQHQRYAKCPINALYPRL